MIGVYLSVPIACFRKGLAREYLETESVPPPATCYGFLLALVGEEDRSRHIGVRIAPMLLGDPDLSVVLRTVWRVKSRPVGSSGNTRPDYQQLLSDIELILWLDSSEEVNGSPSLEERVSSALSPAERGQVERFGGLSLGESTHLVDEVSLLSEAVVQRLNERLRATDTRPRLYCLKEGGLLGLPVWVDHVGSAGTRHVVGSLEPSDVLAPPLERMPQISP